MEFIHNLFKNYVSVCLFFGVLGSIQVHAAQVETSYTTVSRYDVAGKLTGTIAPDPDGVGSLKYLSTRYTYNSRGLLESVENGELDRWLDETYAPNKWNIDAVFTVTSSKHYTYDNLGRKDSEYVKSNDNVSITSLTQYGYDIYDRVNVKTVRMNKNIFYSPPVILTMQGTLGTDGPDRITRYTYNDFDQVLTEVRAGDTPLIQTYVTNTYQGGLLKTQTDANGNVTELRYDQNSRLQRRIYPSATNPGEVNELDYNEFGYDLNGNLTSERKRNGANFSYIFDANNRMIEKHLPTSTNDVYYDYDLRGLQTLASFGIAATASRTSAAYDGFGNLKTDLTHMGGVGRAVYSRFDLNNNRTRVSHQDTVYYTYNFDGLNRLGSIYEGSGTVMFGLGYQNNGHRKYILRRGNLANTSFTRSDGIHLDSFTQEFPGTTNDFTNTFQYNSANQISQLTLGNNLYINNTSNTRTGNYTANGLNQYTHVGGASQGTGQPFAYDLKSNLINDGTLIYAYDDENRLISTNGSVVSSFIYDPRGRLFQATIGSAKTQFLYDGDALVAEYDGNTGVMLRRYVHADQVDQPILQYNSNATGPTNWRYLYADHQGSIVAHSDVNGTVLNTLAYDSYGVPDTRNIDRFGYTGQIWFKELGLFHYKARMYSPKLGRFLQTDPIGYKDQMNLYAYVGNDPINNIDPTGERTWGLNFSADLAVGAVGGKFRFDVNFDTTHKELNFTATGGYKVGAQLGAKLEGYTEPSKENPTGSRVAIQGELKAEAVGEVKTPVGTASANAEAFASGELSTNNAPEGDLGTDKSAGGSWGPVSIDSNGRASVGVGANVGVSGTAEATAKVTLSSHSCSDGVCK